MKTSLVLTALALALAVAIPAAPADAASMSQVLAACKKTAGCGYSRNEKNGDVSGCVVKPNAGPGSCFYCRSDTKQCIAVRETGAGALEPLAGDVLDLLGEPAPAPRPRPRLGQVEIEPPTAE